MALEFNNTVLINGSVYQTKDLPPVCTQLLATAQSVQLEYLLIVVLGTLSFFAMILLAYYMKRFVEAKQKERNHV